MKLRRLAAALVAACVPALAGLHAVGDFKPDFGGSPSDSIHLDPSFGDSLLIRPRAFTYRTLAPQNLTDGVGVNGQAGSIALSAATGPGTFKIAYIGWAAAHSPAPGVQQNPPPGDIITRDVTVDQGVLTLQPIGTVIAGSENKFDPFSPRQFYGGGQNQQPAPAYFSFGAEGNNYIAYWSTLYPSGSVRRTTQAQMGNGATLRGTYLYITPPNKPVVCGGYGELSSAIVPGSSGTKSIVAYEDTIGGVNNQIEVRWEDVTAATSVASRFVRPVIPEDLSVAADSAGDALIIWRENQALWAAGFDVARTRVMNPTQLAAGIYNKEGTIDHYYRSYAAASTLNGTFLVAYGRAGNAKGAPVYLRSVTLPAGTLGTEFAATNVPDTCKYPNIAANANQVIVAWYETFKDGTDSLVGALYNKQGAGIDTASRMRLSLSTEAVSFSTVGSGWYIYHSWKTPGLSMDPKGNIAVAYDNEFKSKLGFVTNTAIYHDSSRFTSKSLSASNPGVPSAYDPAVDSLQFLSLALVTKTGPGKPIQLVREVAVSANGSFTDAGSGFVPWVDSLKTAAGNYKYRITQRSDPPFNNTQTKIDSLTLRFNVKPRQPNIDSIKVGKGPMQAWSSAATYVVLPRRDSVRLVCSAIDIDDESLVFRVSLGAASVASANAARVSAGSFKATLAFMPPDTALNPLPLGVTTADPEGWSSRPRALPLNYKNSAPAETLSLIRSRGKDSNGVFQTAGLLDTLATIAGKAMPFNVGDVAVIKARFGDLNDDSITVTWRRNALQLGQKKIAAKDTLSVNFPSDTAAPLIDTLTVVAADKDTTVTYRLPLRSNRLPAPDSVWFASYKAKDSTWKTGVFDKVKNFTADTGLIVPSGLSAVLKARSSDPDKAFGDGSAITWASLTKGPGCAQGNLACYQKTVLGAGDTLRHVFAEPEQYVLIRAVDSLGAFVEKRLRLEYPILDTASSGGYAAALQSLSQDLDFIIDAKVRSKSVTVNLVSQGNIPLQISSVATGADDGKWLSVGLAWIKPGNLHDTLALGSHTDANPVSGGSPVTVAPGARLAFTFAFSSDSLRGDSVLSDTLYVATNDFANPVLKIPFKIVYNDLPVLRISNLGASAGPAGGYNDKGLPKLLPPRSSLSFAFSEPVKILNPSALVRVYSKLDSIKNPTGYQPIAGSYLYRRKPAGLPKSAAADSIADTLIFVPAYDRKSDSLKVKPRPGFFIHRDVIHIAVSNGITDRVGNPLDLRLDRADMAPNSVDTIFETKVDTGYVRVTSTDPGKDVKGWDPDYPIRVRFNHKLVRRPPAGDTLTTLDLSALKGDSNHGVWITSVNHPKRYDFTQITLQDGDSTLVLRARPKFPAQDTVTVFLSGGVADVDGLTLDGNGDGFPGYFYDPSDSTDVFSFSFITLEQEFYIYPNPYRWQDPRHRAKGSITFKNINSLPGFVPAKEVYLRIHTMDGELVYSSKSSANAQNVFGRRNWTNLDWDLTNGAGHFVGTGVYIYTLILGEDKVLKKGKVAVVR